MRDNLIFSAVFSSITEYLTFIKSCFIQWLLILHFVHLCWCFKFICP